MTSDINGLIEQFPNYTIAVIGDAMLDCYFHGASHRICQEAPVPVVEIQQRESLPGGAANTAVNVSSLGGQVIFLSVIGRDAEGDLLIRTLQEHGIDTGRVQREAGRSTLAKNRILANEHMIVRFDQGSTQPLEPAVERKLIRGLREVFPKVDALIISDYDYGILTPAVIQAVTELQAQHTKVIVVDSKKIPRYAGVGVTAVKPNFEEAAALLRQTLNRTNGSRPDVILQHGDQILEFSGAQIAAVTMDENGALIFEHGHMPYRTYAKPAPNSSATGAGDTYISTLTLALAAGADTPAAAELASAAASVIVQKAGTSACYREDLIAYFTENDKLVTDAFVLAARVAASRRMGKRIVFTNGCFDILHRGHVAYLNKAKTLGDLLIVGLNSDESVRRLKGKTRPINSLEDRIQVLAALSCVDHIVPFEADTPIDLIRLIQPDIYVKGGDYSNKPLPEAPVVEQMGGKVEILPYVEDHSTSEVINRIRELAECTDCPEI